MAEFLGAVKYIIIFLAGFLLSGYLGYLGFGMGFWSRFVAGAAIVITAVVLRYMKSNYIPKKPSGHVHVYHNSVKV